MSRPSLDEFFMGLAEYYGTRNTCPRAKGACVLVKENRFIGAGYVSSASGQPHCTDIGCEIELEKLPGKDEFEERCRRTLHAEQSLLYACAKFGIATDGCVLYTTNAPCYDCAKGLIIAGIRRVVYQVPYRDARGLRLLTECGISVQKYNAKTDSE